MFEILAFKKPIITVGHSCIAVVLAGVGGQQAIPSKNGGQIHAME